MQRARQALAGIQNIRIPAAGVVAIWMLCGWRVLKGGYLQDAWGKAKGYMRSVKL